MVIVILYNHGSYAPGWLQSHSRMLVPVGPREPPRLGGAREACGAAADEWAGNLTTGGGETRTASGRFAGQAGVVSSALLQGIQKCPGDAA